MSAFAFFLMAIFTLGTYFPQPAFAQSNSLDILGGTEGGTYHAMANDIKRLYEKYCHKPIQVLQSTGSLYNSGAIDSTSSAQLGFIHSDTLDYLRVVAKDEGKNCMEDCRKAKSNVANLRYLFPVYTAEVHLLTRDSSILSLEDLDHKRVALGPEGSGTRQTATTLIEAISKKIQIIRGDDTDPYKFDNMKPKEALDALFEGKIDAFFWVTGQPADLLTNRDNHLCDERLHRLSLVPLNVPNSLTASYEHAELDYTCITSKLVNSIKVTSILVTYNFTVKNSYMFQRCKDVAVISKLIRRHLAELKSGEYHEKWKDMTDKSFDAAVAGWHKNACVAQYESLPFQDEVRPELLEAAVRDRCVFDEYCLRKFPFPKDEDIKDEDIGARQTCVHRRIH